VWRGARDERRCRLDAGLRRLLGGPGIGSLGVDDSEAVGAVDGSVHVRLEWALGLVAAASANDREVIANRPAAPVPAGSLAALSHRSPGRPAARAAFGFRHEPLLGVVLLILGRVYELGAAIDTCKCPIDVGHVSPPVAAGFEPFATGQEHRIPTGPRPGHWRLKRIRKTVFGSRVPVWDAPAGREDTSKTFTTQ
jgi:hypothetical protein